MTLSVSHDTATLWRNTGLPADGVIVVHTGIDMEQYVPARSAAGRHPAVIGIDPDALRRPVRRSADPEKGVDVLLRAWRTVQAARPEARLVVVGGPTFGTDPDEADRYRTELDARWSRRRSVARAPSGRRSLIGWPTWPSSRASGPNRSPVRSSSP